ncbi:hypothetical protein Y1Q_0001149 [Alligator mississippiensis]|uniref:Uncharacterized protein n=1 Tax=Alligator mississippiensis TaxID=8496 RepID=A0A151PIT9_ALLMI|nr:hypothetical protein Y1Q_0001149 [Alligator mississippiensis]
METRCILLQIQDPTRRSRSKFRLTLQFAPAVLEADFVAVEHLNSREAQSEPERGPENGENNDHYYHCLWQY